VAVDELFSKRRGFAQSISQGAGCTQFVTTGVAGEGVPQEKKSEMGSPDCTMDTTV